MTKRSQQYLEEQIAYHRDVYYNGETEISDAEFDELIDEFGNFGGGFGVIGTKTD